jgi:CO dehydrogenase nickel-insertion accessory protein CooC1
MLARAFERQGAVLAIDADHNMDLTYNLGNPQMRYLGDALQDVKASVGLNSQDDYRLALSYEALKRAPAFSIEPLDAFSASYSASVSDSIRLMSAGPQTPAVLHDQVCSHGLFTPLKLYLPYLDLKKKECVIVDEKAGADGVTTGLAAAFDIALVVVEPAEHSIKVAQQIAGYLDFFGVPYEYVANKCGGSVDIFASLPKPPRIHVPAGAHALDIGRLDWLIEVSSDRESRIGRVAAIRRKNEEFVHKTK